MDILYKTIGDERCRELPKETVKDIALQEVIAYMSKDSEEQGILKDIMVKILLDPVDMIYRQEIVKDLMNNDELKNAVEESIDSIRVLQYYGSNASKRLRDKDNPLVQLLEELKELKVYVEVVESLYKALSENDIKAEGLISLRGCLKEIVDDENFRSIKPDIEKIHSDLSNVKGAIVGVTFTPDLDIENVTAIEFLDVKPRSSYNIVDIALGAKVSNGFSNYKYVDPLLVSMTPYMKKYLWKHLGDVKKLIAKHANYDTKLLTNLFNGFVFYLSVANLGKKLKSKNYDICFPEITEGKHLDIKGLYNLRLAVAGKEDIVKNDFKFSDDERNFILTGPNRGGKTILEQGLALISVMASLGMFVAADSCEGIPFKNILTHFPIDENLTINYGRLGEEAIRIKSIVSSADDETFIIFNETFSTTSALDALYLSKDLLRILKEKESFVIFNTHIHELAACIPEMNEWEGRGDIISIVMEIKNNHNTFKIKRSAPESSSYARNIAEKYGITYEQMKEINQ